MRYFINDKGFFGATITIILLVFSFNLPPLLAQQISNPRLEIGLNLLPGVIAANTRINAEVNIDKPVKVYMVYENNKLLAINSRKKLTRIKSIRGHQLQTKIIAIKNIQQLKADKYCALFMVEPLVDHVEALVQFSKEKQILLFSPNKGDVKRGVMSGFEVTNKVLPAINTKALKQANIDLKAFFKRIAVQYDE